MSDVRYYMACLDLRGRDCLVVGGGRVATEKAQGLLECFARVSVVAPEIDDELRALDVRVVERPFTRSDLVGRFLVIAATNDRSVNADVSHTANERAMYATFMTALAAGKQVWVVTVPGGCEGPFEKIGFVGLYP